MKSASDQAATAAYKNDGRSTDWRAAGAGSVSGWHPTFDNLLAAGHIFMGYRFSGSGLLFRGMPSGMAEAVASSRFWHSQSDTPLCRLERDLNVVFCSEVARDAMAVAKPWEDGREDAGILVFHSDRFNRRWEKREAAALGFADVGMVFKYPCLAEPLQRDDLRAVLLHSTQREACQSGRAGQLPELLCPQQADSRDSWQALLDDWLRTQDRVAAMAVATDRYPRRQ